MSENVIEEAANLLERCAECLAPHNLGAAQGARDAAASLRKAAEGAEVLYRHRVTGNVYSALDVGNVDHPFVKDAFSHVLVVPIPEPGKEPR